MADIEQQRTRAKAWAAAVDAARRRAVFVLPERIAGRAARLGRLISEWALAEVAPGRLMPWLAVAYGFGIVVYFTADREPAWWAASELALLGAAVPMRARQRPIVFLLALGFAALAAGFATATLRTAFVAHPILQFSASSVTVSGFVEIREERERSDRITLRVHRIESAWPLSAVPERVRLAVRKGTAPAVGSFIELKARLSPPLAPLRPGSYDFACDMYFQRIGTSGYALGKNKVVSQPVSRTVWLHYATFIDAIRETIDKRIRAVIPGDEGAIASALITGKRDATLRWSGVALGVVASLWALTAPLPDILISADGQAAAIRGRDGKLAVLRSSCDTFAIKEWLMADGDTRAAKDASLADGVRCDAVRCIGHLGDGRAVSFALSAEAFAEDCTRAAVVVSAREAPGGCSATLIDRSIWRTNGALTLRWTGDRFVMRTARPPGYERRWSRGASGSLPPARRPATPDAAPRTADLEPSD